MYTGFEVRHEPVWLASDVPGSSVIANDFFMKVPPPKDRIY